MIIFPKVFSQTINKKHYQIFLARYVNHDENSRIASNNVDSFSTLRSTFITHFEIMESGWGQVWWSLFKNNQSILKK